jgi:hypothetical protein
MVCLRNIFINTLHTGDNNDDDDDDDDDDNNNNNNNNNVLAVVEVVVEVVMCAFTLQGKTKAEYKNSGVLEL